MTASQFLGYEDDIGHAGGVHVHFEVAKLDPAHPVQSDIDGYAFDWDGASWLASPNVLPSFCGVGVVHDGDTHVAADCLAQSQGQAPVQLRWTAAWQSPVAGSALLALSGPDAANRVTVSEMRLSEPVSVDVAGRRLSITSIRLVRPFSVSLGPNGIGRFPANQIIVDVGFSTTAANGRTTRSRATGPLNGSATVALQGSSLRLSLDAGMIGTLVASAGIGR